MKRSRASGTMSHPATTWTFGRFAIPLRCVPGTAVPRTGCVASPAGSVVIQLKPTMPTRYGVMPAPGLVERTDPPPARETHAERDRAIRAHVDRCRWYTAL